MVITLIPPGTPASSTRTTADNQTLPVQDDHYKLLEAVGETVKLIYPDEKEKQPTGKKLAR